MPDPHITSLFAPVPCAVCGRLTTRFNKMAGVADCGRDEPTGAAPDGFGPPLRGSHVGRRWKRRRHAA